MTYTHYNVNEVCVCDDFTLVENKNFKKWLRSHSVNILSISILFFFQEYDKDLFRFIIFYLYFAAIFCQFILHCVAEKSDDADPATPKEKVPLMLVS